MTASTAQTDSAQLAERRSEYERAARALLRGQLRGFVHGAGLNEADRDALVCDAVDDTLLAELAGRIRDDNAAARFSYLKVGLRRKLHNEHRRRVRRPAEAFDPDELGYRTDARPLEHCAQPPDPAEYALNRCTIDLLLKAIRSLSPEEREIARRFLFEQRSLREGARELGIDRRRLTAAREEVRVKLVERLTELGVGSVEEAWSS